MARRRLPASVLQELVAAVGPARAAGLRRKLADAVAAYEADRYAEAAQLLRGVLGAAPGAPSVHELYGLSLYRQGRWAAALRQLQAHHVATGSYDQYPVMADCERARGRWDRVEALWEELRAASPGAEVVAEGRLVVAGARADRGDLTGAIALLRQARIRSRPVKPHHLRTWYALADLNERAGELPAARHLFARVVAEDASLYDAAERLEALGGA